MLFVKSTHYEKAVNMEHVVLTDVVKLGDPNWLNVDTENAKYALLAHTVTGKVIPIAFGNIPEVLYERQRALFQLVEIPNGYMENEYCDLYDEKPYKTYDEAKVPF